jgi:hypothetical protein
MRILLMLFAIQSCASEISNEGLLFSIQVLMAGVKPQRDFQNYQKSMKTKVLKLPHRRLSGYI